MSFGSCLVARVPGREIAQFSTDRTEAETRLLDELLGCPPVLLVLDEEVSIGRELLLGGGGGLELSLQVCQLPIDLIELTVGFGE